MCLGCPESPSVAPVRWIGVRVWFAGGRVSDVTTLEEWATLPDDGVLGAVGFRSTGTRDFISGYDWYAWFPFPDGWRVSGNTDSEAENRRRYPDATWKRGVLVSDGEMDRVNRAMREAAWPR